MATKKSSSEKKLSQDLTELDFKKLQTRLRSLDLKWVSNLVKKIREDETVEEDYRNEIDDRKVYNFFNGILRNGQWKYIIYTHAKEMCEDLEKKWEKAKA